MDDSQTAVRCGLEDVVRGTILPRPHGPQPRNYDLAIGSERNSMVARNSSLTDPRVELITRIIGDNRNAPNLWLARRIVQELNAFDARANRSYQECATDWYSDWDGIDPDEPTLRRTN